MREINRLSIHQWLRSANPDSQQPISPIGFLFLKLPQPPCAVLLVYYGSLEVKLQTIWTDEKAEVGRIREEKSKGCKKADKSRTTAFFPCFGAPEG